MECFAASRSARAADISRLASCKNLDPVADGHGRVAGIADETQQLRRLRIRELSSSSMHPSWSSRMRASDGAELGARLLPGQSLDAAEAFPVAAEKNVDDRPEDRQHHEGEHPGEARLRPAVLQDQEHGGRGEIDKPQQEPGTSALVSRASGRVARRHPAAARFVLAGGCRLGAVANAHALDAARIGVEHLEIEAGDGLDHLALRRDAPGRREYQAADRLDVLRLVARPGIPARSPRAPPRRWCAHRR